MTRLLRIALVLWLTGAALPAPADEHGDDGDPPSGICVALGLEDAARLQQLTRGGRTLVHARVASAAARDELRAEIQRRGFYGLASVEAGDSFDPLPYADNLANLVVADLDALGRSAPAATEIQRVLAPGGVARVRKGGAWTRTVKPAATETDQWTHWDYGPAGNAVSRDRQAGPTTALRWYAGPSTSDNASDKVGMRIADGRIVYLLREFEMSQFGRRQGPCLLVVRDAFNGTLLWRRPIDDVGGRGDDPARFALTVVGGRIYAFPKAGGPLEAIDLNTGRTLVRYEQGAAPPPYEKHRFWQDPAEKFHLIVRVFDGKVLQCYRGAVHLLDEKTGRTLWTWSPGGQAQAFWVVVGEGKVFAAVTDGPLAKARSSPACRLSSVAALDLATGRPAWRSSDFRAGFLFRMVYHDGSVIVPTFENEKGRDKIGYAGTYAVACLEAGGGKTRWRSDEGHSAHGHYQVVLVREGKVYVGNQRGFSLDLATGKFLAKHDWGQYDTGCADLRGLPGYTFYGLTFIPDTGAKITRGQARSRCDVGVFPAYGLMYANPSGCLCSNFVNGYVALAAEPPAEPVADENRLTRGPAYAAAAPDAPPQWGRDDWPMHLAGPTRGCVVAGPAPDRMDLLWSVRVGGWNPADEGLPADWRDSEQVPGPITAATAAGGKVFLAVCDAHRLEARDANSGKLAWSFTAGARIDSPPTLYGGLCLFGSRDGYVHCLRADDGKPVWRFLAAVRPKYICVQGQLESAWPVHGSVMVYEGKAVVTAGRQSATDGGIQVYCLDPFSGRLEWKTRIWTDPDADRSVEPRNNSYQPDARRTQNLLVASRRGLYHTIDLLKGRYGPGELVELVGRTASNRGGWVTSDRQKPSAREITVLWANSNGFLSRRLDSVGRNDERGGYYSDLIGEKFLLADDRVYFVCNGMWNRKHRGLIALALDDEGRPAREPLWTAKMPADRTIVHAAALAGEKILLAVETQHAGKTVCSLRVHHIADGRLLAEHPLPGPPVRDALAIANGRLFLAGQDGTLYCYGAAGR